MAISKKPIPSKPSLKLASLEKHFYDSLTDLTNYAIQQENTLSDTLDNLNAKLKKAVLQQKANKKPKKNTTPALEKQALKAQTDIDNLELEIALTTDQLSLMTQKIDHLLAIDELPNTITTPIAAPVKTKKIQIKLEPVAKPAPKIKAAKKVKSETKKSDTKKVEQKTEQFDLSEFFTPDMDFGFTSQPESESNEKSASVN